MKISVNDQEVYTLSEIQKKVIQNDIHADEFESDMRRRINWVLTHKYERCLERLKNEWMSKLKDRMSAVPTDDSAFAELVFDQPDYKSRKQREEKG